MLPPSVMPARLPLATMTSNKSFLWSLAQAPAGKPPEAAGSRDGAPSSFLWRTSSSCSGRGPACSASVADGAEEALYDDAGGREAAAQEDAGFEESPPERPARSSSTRSSATSGVWSWHEPGADSGSALSDECPRYEQPPELKTAGGPAGTGAMIPAQDSANEAQDSAREAQDSANEAQDSAREAQDSADGAASTRPTSVKLLAMRFEALSQGEEPRGAKSQVGRGVAEDRPPVITITVEEPVPSPPHGAGGGRPTAPRLPTRSSSSMSSTSSSGSAPPPWRRAAAAPAQPAPPPPLPPPLTLRRDSFSSDSDSDSPPPSPAGQTPPPPPPLSTLPSRNNSRAQEVVRPSPPASPKDDYENIYETLRGSIEMETYANEPLYQIYNQNAEELAREYISREFESCSPRSANPPASARDCGAGGAARGQFRTLWCQLPEVQASRALDTLSAEVRKLMEAKFEIITSEASYISSLNILKNHFMVHLEQCDEADFCKEDRRLVFGDVVPVRKVAEKMLSQLEACRKKDIFMRGMMQAMHDVARDDLKIYVDYCAYQNCRTRTLERLTSRRFEPTTTTRGGLAMEEVSYRLSSLWSQESRGQQTSTFAQTLASLEAHPLCQGLTLQSFLLVPMQRITKLQLLAGAVLSCMQPDDEERGACEAALRQISEVVHECNEGVRAVERMEELLALSKQLKFDRGMRMLPLYCSNRWLVKRGKVTELNPEWFSARSIYLFIFNDVLFLAKKRRLFPQHVERFLVVDHCSREDVRLMNTEGTLHLPDRLSSGFCMLLTLLSNHRQKKVSKLIYFACESERRRWADALHPPEPAEAARDWPQVVVKWAYVAEQPDELSLQVSDLIHVLTRSADGWYQGRRARDGETGWFPGNYTVDVEPVQLRQHGADSHAVTSVYCA
ncbi:ephexin-1-like [Bacillus rossius redtenbacheri]|uniref:ephexin-1-like n=1 Tax=Bacillus rossius redtenbacheri TaxID=93214 RepID=UPI002FDD21B6